MRRRSPATLVKAARSAAVSQFPLVEKTFFQGLDVPTPPFLAVDSEESFRAALRLIGLPAVLKTRRMGYDGKGQIVLRDSDPRQEKA